MNATDLLVWGGLHDGELRLAEGRVPGDVALHVAIPYLRQHFAPAGEGFVLRWGAPLGRRLAGPRLCGGRPPRRFLRG